MGGINEGRIDREAVELRGYLLQRDEDRVRTRRSEELVRLNIEGGENRGEQTGLYV